MMSSRKLTVFFPVLAGVIVALLAGCTERQNPVDSQRSGVGRYGLQVMHFPSLENNPLNDGAARVIYVACASDTTLAVPQPPFPVLYLLHDFGGGGTYFERYNLQGILDEMYRNGEIGRMLVVAYDASDAFNGSYYRNSSSAGKYEDMLSEVIHFVEQNYRVYTQAGRRARALSGHGMGGYGAMRFAMDHPSLFSSVSSMSGPLSLFGADGNSGVLTWIPKIKAENAGSLSDMYPGVGKPFTNNMAAMASAFSPHPLERVVTASPTDSCEYCPRITCFVPSDSAWCKPCTLFVSVPLGTTTLPFTFVTKQRFCVDTVHKLPAPIGVDFPFLLDANGAPFDSVRNRWIESDVKTSFVRNTHALDSVDVYFDCGADDEWGYIEQNDDFDRVMTDAGKPHIYEKYAGFEGVPADHSQLIIERLRKVIKFHSDRMTRAPGPRSR